MVKYLALAGLSLLPTSPALEQLESEPQCPHGLLCSAWSHHTSCHQCGHCPMAHIMTKLPVTSRSQVQLRININSQSQGLIGKRGANRRREGISLCLMLLICMQCCSHHWSLPLSRADITLGGGSLVTCEATERSSHCDLY